MTKKLSIGIVGAGYWGPNLIRNFSNSPLTQVTAVCDSNPACLVGLGKGNSELKLVQSLDQFLELPMDAVAIATPVSTHFALAKRCLESGLHVLVEKPLTATVGESEALIHLANRQGRILMVDHTYLFSNAVRIIKDMLEQDELGELYYVDSVRINLGLFQHDINVIWDLAPHDLSIIDYLLGNAARSVSAWGCAHADPAIEDIAYVNVDYGDRMLANIHVNWLSPMKVRQMIFAGARKSLIFNELNITEPIKIYDRGISLDDSGEHLQKLMVSYRSGDIRSPYVPPGEALLAMVNHFASCILGEESPISDGYLGLRVVRMLEAATRSIRAQGGRVILANASSDKFTSTNGVNYARSQRSDQRCSSLSGCSAREKCDDSLFRQSVRLPVG